ncbi:MAG: hypothetical protein HYU69_02020 [Bacteroidetes bacterium]|nr:hypothetical protein [Bacteroidota bacterium]
MTTGTEKKAINNYIDLQRRIMQLRVQKYDQEQELKKGIKEIYYTIHPLTILDNLLHKLSQNNEVKRDLKSISLNAWASYFIGRIFGRSTSLKGFLSSVIIEKVAVPVLDKYSTSIFNSLNNFIKRFINRHDSGNYPPTHTEALVPTEDR